MVNLIPSYHVDDVPVVEPNQHDDVFFVPEPVLVDEDEEPKEEEFEEEKEPQEEEDDMEVDIEEDENDPNLTYPYEEVDPLNLSPPASESEPEDVIEVEGTVKSEDETVPASVHEVGESSASLFLQKNSDGMFPGLMRRDINSLFGRMASLSRRMCCHETAHALVKKKGKAKDEYYEKAECKKLKKELEEARGFVFEERPNEAIDVPVEDEKSPSSEPRGSPPAVRRMIKKSVDAAIAAEQARHENAGNTARGSGPVRGQNVAPVVCECTFARFMKYNPALFRDVKGAVELRRWFEKTKSVFGISENAEGKKNNQTQGNVRAITTASTKKKVSFGSLSICERCFTRHDGPCTIKYHKCGKVRHKARYYKEKSVTTGTNALPIPTCYDYGEQGYTRNRCPKKVKQEETGEVRDRAYAIKDAEPQGPNVVTGTFLLNNRCASTLFNSGSDRSFVNTRFSSMLDIDASYEVELADKRVVSTNTVLKGRTLNLHDAVIVYGEKVVRVPYGNKTLIVKSDKEKQLEDVPVIRDFPKVFPDDFSGLPPPKQVEFRIDLVLEAAPVARAPYRLAPSKMKELSVQLQELLEKERWIFSNAYRLPRVEQVDCQESLSSPENRRFI
nr:hypothetical protein [Tanacetum cinerariifolium]